MQRNIPEGSGERLDTMEGFNDLYDEEDDNQDSNFRMEDDPDDEDSDEETGLGDSDKKKKKSKFEHDKIEVNFDDIEDDNDQECLLNYNQAEANK